LIRWQLERFRASPSFGAKRKEVVARLRILPHRLSLAKQRQHLLDSVDIKRFAKPRPLGRGLVGKPGVLPFCVTPRCLLASSNRVIERFFTKEILR
jgi:hypothetical protein